MPKNYKQIRVVEVAKDFPEKGPNKGRFKKGSVHYMHESLAKKAEAAGFTKSVKKYDRDAAIESEKKLIAKVKKAQKEAEVTA